MIDRAPDLWAKAESLLSPSFRVGRNDLRMASKYDTMAEPRDAVAAAMGGSSDIPLDGDRPRIVLNMKEANAAGLRFDPGLLRLARIVR